MSQDTDCQAQNDRTHSHVFATVESLLFFSFLSLDPVMPLCLESHVSGAESDRTEVVSVGGGILPTAVKC